MQIDVYKMISVLEGRELLIGPDQWYQGNTAIIIPEGFRP